MTKEELISLAKEKGFKGQKWIPIKEKKQKYVR